MKMFTFIHLKKKNTYVNIKAFLLINNKKMKYKYF